MKATKHRPLRFVIVGISNTVLDFTLMNLLSLAGLNLIIANTISTGIAMIYSFFMNKKWTFRNAGQDYLRQVILFFIFTAIGIWVIQNGLIILAQHYLPRFGLSSQVFNNLAKLGASVFSLTWNYLTYNRFVFTDKH
ncbi:MAG: GtrA family protein [Candidatus Nanoperiomorbus sp.]